MYAGEWCLKHSQYGSISVQRLLDDRAEQQQPGKMKSLVRSVTSALQLDQCDYQVRINGQEKKVITYSDAGRNTYSCVLAALSGVVPLLNAAIPEGRGTLARRFVYEHVPWLDPANNHFFQLVLDYNIITLPLLAAVMVVGFKLIEPMMSCMWMQAWSKVAVAKYL